jgi:adenosylmethionine-8-amino-7-oxononanoate aminotransferase
VTSGYLPLGGVIVGPTVAEPFWSSPGRSFAHGQTYSGHPTCCAAALANLELLAHDDLVHRAAALEQEFHGRLAALERHPLVGEVRGGVGLMAAVALEAGVLAEHDGLPRRLYMLARDAGLLTRALGDGIAVAPPLIVESDQLDEAVSMIDHALELLARDLGA